MYLEHFGFRQYPFHLTPDTELFLGLSPHYEAIQTVCAALDMGEGIVKVTGEVGTGKTMVCRMLVKQLAEKSQLVYLPNAALGAEEMRLAVAKELDVDTSDTADSVIDMIQHRLIDLAKQNRPVIVLVDEAQALEDGALEVLRLFGNLETEQQKLMQIVLFGQPELDYRLQQQHLRQLRQRITFSAQLRTLSLSEVVAYIDNRLQKASPGSEPFSLAQKKVISRASNGVPRLINQICHKAMVLACVNGQRRVENLHLFEAIHDTFDSRKPKFMRPVIWGWSRV
ncbi:ExeA family protein [Vibrio sonorensis]|uniref:ExeA family protein n=1 Tax=Vibrio sonorensis TaxID=1004316 RepID=UPI0008DA9670|nr:AAA family ATPase [Vibrio sonorensis]